MTGHEIGSAILAGLGIGTLIIAGFTARTLITLGRSGRMPDLYRLMGIRYH